MPKGSSNIQGAFEQAKCEVIDSYTNIGVGSVTNNVIREATRYATKRNTLYRSTTEDKECYTKSAKASVKSTKIDGYRR